MMFAPHRIAALRAGAQLPNLIVAPGEAGAGPLNDYPYLVTRDGDAYTVERNGGGYANAMVFFSVATVVGRRYRFRIEAPVASHEYRLSFTGVLQDNVPALEFVATGTVSLLNVAATAATHATLSFRAPSCRLIWPTS